MRHPFTKYLLILVLSISSVLKAQQFYFKNYSVESGLPFVQVYCMFQDSKGYLWSGGYGGLSCFDGKSFINYSPKNGLINHYVNAICEDDSGTIYAGTVEGLSILKNKKIIANYNTKNGLAINIINALCFKKNEGVYIGTTKGLFCFKNGQFSTFSDFDKRDIKCLKSIDGVLCIGTSNGLFYFDRNSKTIRKQEGLDNNNINCLAYSPGDSSLLVGTNRGFSIIKKTESKPYNYHIENGLIDENISSIYCSDVDRIWVGSGSGLLKFDGKEFSFYNIYNENNSNHIRSILKDTEGNLWLGTHAGLFRYRDNAFSSFKNGGIANAMVFQIFRDKKNDLWFCSETGVFRYSQGFFNLISTKDGLADNYSIVGLEDDDGTIWLCSNKGISWYKNGSIKNFTSQQGFKLTTPISVIYKDKQNTIWVGGKDGVAAFKKINGAYTPTYYMLPELTQEWGVSAFVEDNNGGLWLGTSAEGLYKLENNTFVQKNSTLNIKPSSFFTLLCDKNNVLYGATLNGLWIYDQVNNTQKIISEKEGLNSELIYSLKFTDNENGIWIGTNQGINKLDLNKYRTSKTIDIAAFGKAEGFSGVECNSYGIWEDKDSTLWFGTVGGIIKYEPNAFKRNTLESKTYITSIKLQNEDTTLSSGVLLPYNYNNIAFYYRGISLTNPDRVRYMKMLEGLETKWSEPSTEDYSKYGNLAPGKYTFKVKSCNSEGVWNTEAVVFEFEIKTPYFKTWWFILTMVVLAGGLIIAVFQIRVQNIRKKEKADFDRKVEISKVELKALRAQMNPHFVFNSLNSIQHYILNSKSNEAAKYLNKFAKLIRIILSNSEKSMVTVNEDVESLNLYLELESMRFDGKFDYTINVDKSVDGDYDEIPPMLMQPYIENAILHGLNPKETKGHLKIDIFIKNNYIVCRITDDGIGRVKSGEIKRTTPGNLHKSLGMKITSERVRILNDINKSDLSVSVTDMQDANGNSNGTMVEIYIPHFN
jgi:ligand-binding sensor domain-containing protein